VEDKAQVGTSPADPLSAAQQEDGRNYGLHPVSGGGRLAGNGIHDANDILGSNVAGYHVATQTAGSDRICIPHRTWRGLQG
jgi:hypothetical protein